MVNFICGVLAGILTGFGAGGGLMLVVLMSYLSGFSQLEIQTINLVYYIPTAFFAFCVYSKEKEVDYKLGIKLILMAALTAIGGAKIAHIINIESLRKLFGVYVTVVGVYFLFQCFQYKVKT